MVGTTEAEAGEKEEFDTSKAGRNGDEEIISGAVVIRFIFTAVYIQIGGRQILEL